MLENNYELGLYSEPGYAPLFESGHDWMVAAYNGCPFTGYIERHTTSDEAFILMAGRAIMLVGDTGTDAGSVKPVELELFQAINIKKSVWHTVLSSCDARILIVENRDVTRQNSDYWTCPDTFLSSHSLHDIYYDR
ncbi:MAG: hypothetical protein WCU00_00325 [Candidatus Latescibacterota bacterium]